MLARTVVEPHALASAKLAFTRDGRELLVARAHEVVVHATTGATRTLRIAGAHQLIVFDDQLWAVCDQRIERWSLARRCRLGEIRIERDTCLVQTFAGPAVASCGTRRWRAIGTDVVEDKVGPGALPVLGNRTVSTRRHGGARFAMFGSIAWRLPIHAEVVAVAALFDGNALAVILARGGTREAWVATLAGEIRQRVKLPRGDIRIAAQRGLAVVHDGMRVSVFDLRYGRALGTARAEGTDIAIDPDGRYLAIDREGEPVINTLAHVCAEPHAQRRSHMEEEEQGLNWDAIVEGGSIMEDLGGLGELAAKAGGAASGVMESVSEGAEGGGALPIFGLLHEGQEMVEDIENGDTGHAISDGAGVAEKTAEMFGKEGAGGAIGALKGAWDIGLGVDEIATDEEGFGDQSLDGVEDLLHGGGEAAAAFGPAAAAVGGAFNVGMDVGDAIAPLIFGSEEEDNQAHTEEVPGNADGSEGTFYPTTGNGAVDWVFGTGDYSEGRF